MGIPHSVLKGRIVRPGIDPQWLETDTGYALAWQRNRADTCSGCGTRPDQWTEDEHAFISDHVYCEGCARLADEQGNLPKDSDGRPRPGFHVFLSPRELYEAREEAQRAEISDP